MGSNRLDIKRIAFAGVGAALVFVATFTIRFPILVTQGYVNLGDAVILILSFLVGPFAALPAAIGSALGDLIAGYPQYIIPTFVIKGLMGAAAGALAFRSSKQYLKIAAAVLAEAVMVAGYFIFEALPFMYGPEAALASVPFNCIQGAVGIVAAVSVSYLPFFSKMKHKLN